MPTVIQVENISKQYRLGMVGSGTIRDDFSRFLARIQGKEDPTLKIGQTNILNGTGSKDEGPNSKYVWALKDINFEVKQGEVLGIIGKNGAGKSTLLKILSKVTSPTTGIVSVKGRIASLLEVGTGFHPELSGRENIFLNGAILGMTKAEIRAKFDEIVDFAGVATYIDTPVKRYSSGMYVRLAFAVAAHLEPEILVVDEVLAVGDAEFQKKALGKMQDISKGQGRTVLFVSHNMAAVKSLCSQAILLENGFISKSGDVAQIISAYLSGDIGLTNYKEIDFETEGFRLKSIGIKAENKNFSEPINREDNITLIIEYDNRNNDDSLFDLSIGFKSDDGNYFLATSTAYVEKNIFNSNKNSVAMKIPAFFFNEGVFYIDVLLVKNKKKLLHYMSDVLCFDVLPEMTDIGSWMGKTTGYIKTVFPWN